VELDALAKTNLAKRSGRLFNGHGVRLDLIGSDLEKNTNFEGSLVDALRRSRAENDFPELFFVALAAVALVHGYGRGGILMGVVQMFTVAITGVCRAVQV